MAVFVINDSFCRDKIASQCMDLLFDKYGTPQSVTTGEDIMNEQSRLKFNIPDIGEYDEVEIRFTEKSDGTISMSMPVIILKGSADYVPKFLSGPSEMK